MSSPVRITRLRCEYLVDPLGIDEPAPRLSWELESDRTGARQIACRIRVASTPARLTAGEADRWDSGRLVTDRTTQHVYAGAALQSRDRCHWQVDVEDETGAIVQSAPARWTMGLLQASDWSAQWIALDPAALAQDPAAKTGTLTEPGTPGVFRKTFTELAQVVRATLYVTARGLVHPVLNGAEVTADRLIPEWTDYDKRIQYRTYEVSALLRADADNELTLTLGDGWWSGYVGWQEKRGRYGSLENSVCAQLELERADGSRRVIGTDATWQSGTGPLLASDFMMGEQCDARREPAHFLPARVVAAPVAPRVAQRNEPVRFHETFSPVSRHEIRPGIWIFDLGQNISGVVRLRLRSLPAGTRLTLRHGERLSPDGTLYTDNLRRAVSVDTYLARGDAEESYTPLFTFHGFQYVELTGLPGQPDAETVTGLALSSGTPVTGHFDCSHTGVNRLWQNGLWSQHDNFISVPTDCPQRDERLGWMGDAQVFCRTSAYNCDVAAFFTKWMIDVTDAQTADGVFPDVAPRLREDINWVGLPNLAGAAGWADAGIIIPYLMWQVYGDRRILERHYGAMVKWVDWIERHNPDGLRLHQLANNYGDWLCIPTDTSFGTHSPMKYFLATAYWADDCAKLARIARELGYDRDAARFQFQFEKVRAALQREWLKPDGELAVETQTAYLLMLAFDLLPPEARTRAAARLVDNIRTLDWHLSTGFIGISHLNPQLTLAGHADVAYRLLLQETYPSWLYPVRHGATTIWERWNGWTAHDGFFNPHMNSFNHYSLGSVGEWLFRHVAGIELDPSQPGFQHFVLQPFPGAGLSRARATYRSHHGEIVSAWQVEGAEFVWEITIPANCSARVRVPGTLRPEPLTSLFASARNGEAILPAGRYTLRSTLAAPQQT